MKNLHIISLLLFLSSNFLFAQATLIPDVNFEQALIDLGYDTAPIDGEVVTTSINGITALNLRSKGITSLSGIEDFVSLTSLDFGDNNVSSVVISKLVNLTTLNCFNNNLSILDIESNVALESLTCENNNLNNLDLSNNIHLEFLRCYNNEISSLDLSNNLSLYYLWCSDNMLNTLNVSANVLLETFFCSSNSLNNLDVSANIKLQKLNCSSNNLGSLDLTQNTELEDLSCADNNLTNLDLASNSLLVELQCSNNTLNSIDISTCDKLEEIRCSDNNLSTLDLDGKIVLSFLRCNNNNLSLLDVSSNVSLDFLSCNNNSLSVLDVSNNLFLERLDCRQNALKTLDVSNSANLWYLDCSDNNIIDLVLSHNVNLVTCHASRNKLTTLDLRNNAVLQTLFVNYNDLYRLDLRNGSNNILWINCVFNTDLDCVLVDDPNLPSIDQWIHSQHTSFASESTTPVAVCNSGLSFTVNDQNPSITVTVEDIDDNSSSSCGVPALSFDAAGTVTALSYDCMDEPGLKAVTLYASGDNGSQSSCATTINLEIEMSSNNINNILEALYTSTSGANWTNNFGWLTNCDPCDAANNGANPWYGITCDAGNQSITKINLHANNLHGNIPGELGSIMGLTELTLHSNNLSGCYPQQLVGLCGKSGFNFTDAMISESNVDLTSWTGFCDLQFNACCPSMLEIDWTPVCDGIYKSSGDIILSTALSGNSGITLSTGVDGRVTVPSGASVVLNASTVITENGCN